MSDIDPFNHEHDLELIQDWHDPTGEAAVSVNFTRLLQCKICEMYFEESRSRDDDIEGIITNDDHDSLGLGGQKDKE